MGEKTAGEILQIAREIVEGYRNTTHGDKERSFATIATFWSNYLSAALDMNGQCLTGYDVAQMMVLLKIARAAHGTRHSDHAVDAAGYAAIAGELA